MRQLNQNFHYDHKQLIPNKTYKATKKTFVTNYRRCVKGGEANQSSALNIGKAAIGQRYRIAEISEGLEGDEI